MKENNKLLHKKINIDMRAFCFDFILNELCGLFDNDPEIYNKLQNLKITIQKKYGFYYDDLNIEVENEQLQLLLTYFPINNNE